MSEFHVVVIRVGELRNHPNADSLDILNVFDYQVIVKRGVFQTGQLAVYVPIDSVVPDTEEWHFLAHNDTPVGQVPLRHRTIEAKRLRGIFSQGMLSPLPHGDWKEDDNVAAAMGITKYEEPEELSIYGECEPAPKGWLFQHYTDVEGLRRYPDILIEGEEVVLTEKLHGCNFRAVHDGNRLWIGSHHQTKRFDPNNLFWSIAIKYDLEKRLANVPWLVFFGEGYGQVQDLRYDVKNGAEFRVFDLYDIKADRYLDFDDAFQVVKDVGLDYVPILYRGPWNTDLNTLCEGQSTIANNVREGFVVRPVKERWDERVGRVCLKRHGEGYLLRKKGKR